MNDEVSLGVRLSILKELTTLGFNLMTNIPAKGFRNEELVDYLSFSQLIDRESTYQMPRGYALWPNKISTIIQFRYDSKNNSESSPSIAPLGTKTNILLKEDRRYEIHHYHQFIEEIIKTIEESLPEIERTYNSPSPNKILNLAGKIMCKMSQ